MALLNELHDLVPSYANSFHWVDHRCQVTNVYDESPESMKLLPIYLNEYLNKGEVDAVPATSELVAKAEGVLTTAKVARPGFKKTTFYNEFLRPTRHLLAAGAVVEQNGVRLGLLLLHRDTETEFSLSELRLIEELSPYIAHGLTSVRPSTTPLIDSDDSSLLILDQQNRVMFASPRVQHFLFLCRHDVLTAESVKPGKWTLPAEVIGLANRLRNVFRSGATPRVPPILTMKTQWGEFVFYAHWLDSAVGEAVEGGAVGITIRYREPVSIRLFRKSKRLGLSPKQIRIGSLLADGLPYERIAQDMGVSQHTVIDHVRKLFDKFDVRNRSELLMKLLSA